MESVKKFNEFMDDINEKSSNVIEETDMLFEMASVGYFNTFKKKWETRITKV